MKICYIHHAGYPQIGRITFFEYSRKAACHGLDVSVICTKDNRSSEQIASGPAINVYEIPFDKAGRQASLAFFRRAAAIVERIQPDIVHCFHSRGVVMLPLLLRRENPRPRFILDIRSGHLSEGLKGHVGCLANYLETLPFNAVAFIDPKIQHYAIGKRKVHKPVFHFPMGVDWKIFAHGDGERVENNFIFRNNRMVAVYSGELSPTRDLRPLVRALALVIKEIPFLHVVFLGEGSDREKLKHLGDKLGIGHNLHFKGLVPFSEIPVYYRSTQIGLSYVPIIPQFDNQPPLKVFEYMAAGLVVVATKTTYHEEIIVDGYNGFLVDDAPDALAFRLGEIVSQMENMEAIRENAQETARKFDWHEIFRTHILPAYRSLGGI